MAIAIVPKCYATLWSYGEICVRCNCCGRFNRNPLRIARARLGYWRDWLKDCLHFSQWDTDPEGRKRQERINHLHVRQARRQVRYYRARVAALKGYKK